MFLLNLPLILLGLLGAAARARESSRTRAAALAGRRRRRCSPCVGLGGVIYALTDGAGARLARARAVLIAAVIGVVLRWPRWCRSSGGVRAPMLRLSLFGSRQFDAINVTTVLLYGALAAASYLLILQCELRLGYSAAAGGRRADPGVGGLPRCSPRSAARWSPRIGPALADGRRDPVVAAAFVWLSGAQPGSSYARGDPARRAAVGPRASA